MKGGKLIGLAGLIGIGLACLTVVGWRSAEADVEYSIVFRNDARRFASELNDRINEGWELAEFDAIGGLGNQSNQSEGFCALLKRNK